MATPYQNHSKLGHRTSRYSPNGIDIILECDDCDMRFLFSPGKDYPETLYRNYRNEDFRR